MPLTKSFAGNATSPAIYDNRVVLYRANHVDHFLIAFDKYTGEEIWKIIQGEKFVDEMACTACPILLNAQSLLTPHDLFKVTTFPPELAVG